MQTGYISSLPKISSLTPIMPSLGLFIDKGGSKEKTVQGVILASVWLVRIQIQIFSAMFNKSEKSMKELRHLVLYVTYM